MKRLCVALLMVLTVAMSGCAGSGGGTVVTPAAVASDVIVDMVATATSDGTPTVIDPMKNFTDKTGKVITIVSQPKIGTATVDGDGKITYTASGKSGTDQFSISCSGKVATIVVVITGSYLNNDTVIIASSAGTPVVIDLSKNGASMQSKVIKITQAPTNGTATVITSGVDVNKIRYTCNVGASGVDFFQYSIDSTTYSVVVGIAQVTPIANDDVVTTNAGANQQTIDVLANDVYLRAKKITITKQPTIGTASINVLGSGDVIVYQLPSQNMVNSIDTLQYTVDGSNVATVTININQQIIVPILTSHNIIGTASKLIDVVLNVNVTAGKVTITTPPTNGIAAVVSDTNGYNKIQYTPNTTDIQDSLTYTIDNSQPTPLAINVLPVIPAITIAMSQYTVGTDLMTGKQILNNLIVSTTFGNASGNFLAMSVIGTKYLWPQGVTGPLSFAVANIVTPAAFGTVSPTFNNGRNNLIYIPSTAPLCGPYPQTPVIDTFTYSVPGTGSAAMADTATATITVIPGAAPAVKPTSCP